MALCDPSMRASDMRTSTWTSNHIWTAAITPENNTIFGETTVGPDPDANAILLLFKSGQTVARFRKYLFGGGIGWQLHEDLYVRLILTPLIAVAINA